MLTLLLELRSCQAYRYKATFIMVIKAFTQLLLAASAVLAHPGGHEKVYEGPVAARGLGQCNKAFAQPEFVKRTVEIHGEELLRLRRALGIEPENA